MGTPFLQYTSLTTGGTRLPFPYYVRLTIEIPFPFLFLGTPEQHTSFFSNRLINKSHLDAKKGSSNDNRDVDKNGKKAIGLDWQNNNFCTFLCHHCTTTFTTWKFLFSRFVDEVNTTQRLSFFFPELWHSLLEFNLPKNLPTFDKLNKTEKGQ